MDCRKKLYVCTEGRACQKKGSDELFSAFKTSVRKYDLKDYFKVKKSDCLGYCKHGPTVWIKPDKVAYGGVGIDRIREILGRHMISSKPLDDLVVNKAKKKK